MVVYLAKEKRVITIDHREMAPQATTAALLLENGKERDFDTSVASGISVGVPGTVRGWHEALSRYGTMSFKQVLAPAITVASKGFVVDANFHHMADGNEKKFARFPATSALYQRNGRPSPSARCCAIRTWRAATAISPPAARPPSMRARWRAPSSTPSTGRKRQPASRSTAAP
jgi:gamma-glutamyltranspeptidase